MKILDEDNIIIMLTCSASALEDVSIMTMKKHPSNGMKDLETMMMKITITTTIKLIDDVDATVAE